MGLAHSTLQQRLTVTRLYHDYLVEKQLRSDTPVGRGYDAPGRVGRGSHFSGDLYSANFPGSLQISSGRMYCVHSQKNDGETKP